MGLPPKYDPENPPVENATELKDLVEKLAGEKGEIDDRTAHSLTLHLTAVMHFEKQKEMEKAIEHIKGFKMLLEHHKKNESISEKVYKVLIKDADQLLNTWNKAQ